MTRAVEERSMEDKMWIEMQINVYGVPRAEAEKILAEMDDLFDRSGWPPERTTPEGTVT